MKKSMILAQIILLILFFILLYPYSWPEEIILLFLIPLLIVFLISGFITLVIALFRKINFRKLINRTFLISSVLQLLLCGMIIWSSYPLGYTKEEVADDLDQLVVLMEDIHPDLYAVTHKESVYRVLDSLKLSLKPKVSENEVYRIFATLTASIKDAHTGLDLKNFIKRGSVFFRKVPPYVFRIKDNKIYILKNYYLRKMIPVGSEVLSINNIPVTQCLAEVSSMLSHETNAYRDSWLQWPLLWGLWNDFNDFEITYKTQDGQTETIDASSGLIANFQFVLDLSAGFGFKNYTFNTLDGNVGYIDLRAFDNLPGFKIFLDKSFSHMKENNTQNLVIDLRKNGGGASSVSEELMQYISPVAYHSFDTSLLKISKYLIKKYALDTTIHIPGKLELEERDMIGLRENPLRFQGNCYVLISGYCFSTALDFPAMVRCYGAGVLIGSETGGRTRSFGSPVPVTLPGTGTKLKISGKKFVNPCATDSVSGLIPDHIVYNSIDDDVKKIDRVMEYTLQLIKTKED